MIDKQSELKNKRTMLNSIVIVVAIIMLWRGIWGLLDVYLFPEIPGFKLRGFNCTGFADVISE